MDLNTELAKRSARVIFVNHSPQLNALREPTRAREVAGYFVPPYFAWLPNGLLSLKQYELCWTFHLWHELRHMEDSFLCSLGMHQAVLNNLSEDLAVCGVMRLGRGEADVAARYWKLSLDLLRKLHFFSTISHTVGEIVPTYMQASKEGRRVIESRAFSLLKIIFPRRKVHRVQFRNFWDATGEYVATRLTLGQGRREHVLGYSLGKTIHETHGLMHVFYVPLLALSIDFGQVDLIRVKLKELVGLTKTKATMFHPEIRIRKLLGAQKLSIDEILHRLNRVAKVTIERTQSMYAHPHLPKEVQYIYRRRPDEARRILEFEQSFKGVRVGSTNVRGGSLFFFVPALVPKIYAQGEKDFIQFSISQAYSRELVLRKVFNLRRYPAKLFRAMGEALNKLTLEVDNPWLGHEITRRQLSKWR